MKNIILLLLFVMSPFSMADQCCDNLNNHENPKQEIIPSDKSGYKVIESKRLYFYSAPNEKCKINGVFIIKNDTVDAYKVDGGFVFVIYFTKDNKTVEGWVKLKGLAPLRTGVGPLKN